MASLQNSLPEYVVFTKLDLAINWAKKNSLAYLTVDLSCCGVELLQASGPRFDIERFGAVEQSEPTEADLMIIAGSVSYKVLPYVLEMYQKMPNPKYVIALGSCASSGGMFSAEYSYSTLAGCDKIMPVDIYIPGCPPRPEALLFGLLELQKKISNEKILVMDELK